MIEQTRSYKTDDGEVHATLDDAQRHAIKCLLNEGETPVDNEQISNWIINSKDAVLAILGNKARKPSTPKTANNKTRSANTPA